ncbi:MAG TPA: hypothetical protein VF877_08110 [Gaiellaceae bacterium]
MSERRWQAKRFEGQRPRLRQLANRTLCTLDPAATAGGDRCTR